MLPIKAIVFDVYGTLFNVDSIIPAAERQFPGYGRKISELWRRKQLEYTWLRSLMERYADFGQVTDDALSYTLQALKLQNNAEVRSGMLKEYLVLKPFPEVPAALNRLQQRMLAVLSNGTPFMLHSVLSHSGLLHYFPAVMSVDPLRIYKPYKGVYQLAPSTLGISKEEILFVSANSFDAAGGKNFGLQVCWVNRANIPFDVLDVKPDFVVRDLDQLVQLLG